MACSAVVVAVAVKYDEPSKLMFFLWRRRCIWCKLGFRQLREHVCVLVSHQLPLLLLQPLFIHQHLPPLPLQGVLHVRLLLFPGRPAVLSSPLSANTHLPFELLKMAVSYSLLSFYFPISMYIAVFACASDTCGGLTRGSVLPSRDGWQKEKRI